MRADIANAPVPGALTLGRNDPNPFNPSTVIPFTLPDAAHVRLDVFDAPGLASGVYLYRLQADASVRSATMMPLK